MQKNMITLALAAVFWAVCLNGATAQTAAIPTAPPVLIEEIPVGKMTVVAPAPIRLIESGELPTNARIVGVMNPPEDVNFEGVMVEGYARGVDAEGQKVGQVVWSQVTKTFDGEKRVAPLDEAWATQMFVEGEIIPGDEKLGAQGNMAALTKAIKQLYDVEKEPADEEEGEKDQKAMTDSTTGKASPSSENDVASDYQPAELAAETATPVEAFTDTTMISTDGCGVRVDETQGVAIQQSKTVTISSGSTTESACSDSDVRYELQRSYLRCTDEVDIPGLQAWPRYITYYTDGEAANNDVGDCTRDEDQRFEIVEDATGCSIYTDLGAQEAGQQVSLVYMDSSNNKVTVRGCQPPDVMIPITTTDTGCSIRHDFTAQQSIRMEKSVFTMGGIEYTAQECTDTATVYPHETVSTVGGIAICEMLISTQDMKAYPQFRTRIEVEGTYQYITDCTPDAAQALDLSATHDGCDWVHDIPANTSYEEQRHYYMSGGSRVYVNACQTSTTSFTHQVEGGEVHGYVNHDAEKYSQEKTALYIDTPYGRVEVDSAQVREGAPQFAYVFARTEDVANGTATYEGCSAYNETNVHEIYTRADSSEYSFDTGVAGTPVGPTNVCQDLVVKTDQVASGRYTGPQGSVCFTGSGNGSFLRTIQYAATVVMSETVNPHTDEVISTSCEMQGAWNAITTSNTVGDSCGVYTATNTRTLYVPPCPDGW
ncbi:hypothetical protein [Magnetospira sp. QH-2]|uniref:hypothetical protein n=1 Tax=Magnetospira sp. (strain QH-2) TaxID=1288970 RepID=UPI0005F9E8E1|nr:hypothetical protein [Magnetospira sp. QH-2]